MTFRGLSARHGIVPLSTGLQGHRFRPLLDPRFFRPGFAAVAVEVTQVGSLDAFLGERSAGSRSDAWSGGAGGLQIHRLHFTFVGLYPGGPGFLP